MSHLRIIFVFTILIILMLTSVGIAEPTYDDQGDLILPNSELLTGKIDDIESLTEGSAYIMINDIQYTVDENTIYRNLSGNKTRLYNFKSGMYVEFYAREKQVFKLRAMDFKGDGDEVGPQDVSPEQGSDIEGLRLENGVWKN